MKSNGNFVLRIDVVQVYWNITTTSFDGALMLLQENGNLIIRSNAGAETIWQTNKP